jgi:protein-disulfide isomerase
MVEGLYERQGGENSGWVTDTLIRQVAGSIPGLNVAKLMKDRDSKQVDRLIATAKSDAQTSGVQGTPAFFAGKPPGALHQLQLQSLDPASFDAALNAALAQ